MRIYEGEVRKIGIEVENAVDNNFVIDAADYVITDKDKNIITEGLPTIDGHRIFTLFSGTNKGVYQVTFKYHIGPEILKARIFVEVI
jgi:hypothetical protein